MFSLGVCVGECVYVRVCVCGGVYRQRGKYPQIQVSCEASAGEEGYTCRRPGALSAVFLSLPLCPAGRAGASQPPHPASTSQIQASSAQPCVAISGNSFRMLPVHWFHSSSSSLPFSLSVTPSPPLTLHLHTLAICPMNLLYFLFFFVA